PLRAVSFAWAGIGRPRSWFAPGRVRRRYCPGGSNAHRTEDAPQVLHEKRERIIPPGHGVGHASTAWNALPRTLILHLCRSIVLGSYTPDDRPPVHDGRRKGQVEFGTISRVGQIDAVQGRDFLLIVGATDGRLHHSKFMRAGVAFVFHASHADHVCVTEKTCGELRQFVVSLGRGSAARGTANLRRPRTNLAARERRGDLPLAIEVLKTKIDIRIRPLDPLLHYHVLHDHKNA